MSFGFTTTYVALWLVVAFQTLLTTELLRQIRRLKFARSVAGTENRLPLGAPAPSFSGTDLRSGAPMENAVLLGRPALLLLMSTSCSICQRLAEALSGMTQEELPPTLVVCDGDLTACRTFVEKLPSRIPVLVNTDTDVRALFGLSGVPAGIILDPEGRVRAYSHPRQAADIRAFVADIQLAPQTQAGGGSSSAGIGGDEQNLRGNNKEVLWKA
jgi:hypothetical protein